jgi:hypothetical protein
MLGEFPPRQVSSLWPSQGILNALPWPREAGDYQPGQRVGEASSHLARRGVTMDLTASQAADRAAAIL